MKTTGTKNNRSARAIKVTAPKKPTTPLTPLNDKLTLRELLTMISSTAGVSIPTTKALRESDTPIAIYATNNFSISVYPSGFALAVSYKRTTVVRVDECTDYSYDTLHEALANYKKSATPSHIGFEVFLDTAWPVRVTMTAEDRLEDAFFIGRGIDYAIGMEGSLKLKEISYIHSEAYAAGELKHGPISLIEDGTIVLSVVTQDKLIEKTISNMVEVKSRGAKVMAVTIAGNYFLEDTAEFVCYVPAINSLFAGSLSVIPLQLISYYVSVGKGYDVDKPRNLAKSVTVE